jgi:hypothetical protein
LPSATTRGVSNVFASTTATVSLRAGLLVVVIPDDLTG